MTSQATSTTGVTIARGDGGTPTEVFTTIGEVIHFQGPGGNAKIIDVTSLDSTTIEKLAGLPDEGQLTLECNLVPADVAQKGLRTDRAARTKRNFKITLTDAAPTVLTFSAYVLNFSVTGQSNDKLTVSVTLEISGPVTWTP